MDETETLRSEHRLIELLAAELAAFVAAPEPPEGLGFLHFRREFGRTLGMYLKRKDWVVYPALRDHARSEVRELAQSFCAASAALTTAFQVYSRAWTSLTIAADWKGFQAATAALLASLHDRIAMEEDELYPLLTQSGDARPPQGTAPFAGQIRTAWHQTADRAPVAMYPEAR